jgi:phage-related baseplate assembly protein
MTEDFYLLSPQEAEAVIEALESAGNGELAEKMRAQYAETLEDPA